MEEPKSPCRSLSCPCFLNVKPWVVTSSKSGRRKLTRKPSWGSLRPRKRRWNPPLQKADRQPQPLPRQLFQMHTTDIEGTRPPGSRTTHQARQPPPSRRYGVDMSDARFGGLKGAPCPAETMEVDGVRSLFSDDTRDPLEASRLFRHAHRATPSRRANSRMISTRRLGRRFLNDVVARFTPSSRRLGPSLSRRGHPLGR
jgi:hypothetical protein